jgi:hypothetical protein
VNHAVPFQAETFCRPYLAHFTAAGYEEAVRAIVDRLEADGFSSALIDNIDPR